MKIGQPEPDITQKPTIHASGSKTAGAAPPKKVVVVGGANVDIVGQALQPIAQGDSTPGHMAISRGGVGRNLAENLARLGMATQLFSAVGSDHWGRMVCYIGSIQRHTIHRFRPLYKHIHSQTKLVYASTYKYVHHTGTFYQNSSTALQVPIPQHVTDTKTSIQPDRRNSSHLRQSTKQFKGLQPY